jgi:crotonobetainyl-CoA:carnitine CoA-transferase CaiB-like acyl-CoA transferase
MSEESVDGPLAGIRVLEVGGDLPTTYAAMILGDLGADVVKIERSVPEEVEPLLGRLGHTRVVYDRNKRSVALDLTHGDAAETLRRAVGWADVVLHDLGPDARIAGLTAEDLGALNPDAVVGRVSPFGTTGRQAGDRGGDLVIQALSGSMDLTGEKNDPPTRAGVPTTDVFTAAYTVIGVLAGLLARPGSRAGRRIDVAALDVAVALLSNMSGAYYATGDYRSRLGTGHISIFPYNSFPTSDGEVVIAIFTQSFWGKFCDAIGHPDLLTDERYTTIAKRMERKDELTERFNEIFAQRTTAEWCEALEAADVPYAPVSSVGEALDHPQTLAREMTPPITGADPDLPATRTVGSPLKFAYSDGSRFAPPMRLAPARGRDTQTFLAELGDGARTGTRPSTPVRPGGGPLDGIKVLDFTRMLAGPWAAEILADLGAQVTKIEEPRIGDPTRKHRPLFGTASSYFLAVNRGKRSVALDVRTPAGKRIVDALIAEADIILENFRPGVMARLGIDFATVRQIRPDIVFCSLSGFGATGPFRERISFDLVNQALAGMVDATGHPGNKAARIGVPVGDLAGGVYLTIAALAGLHRRRSTGQGTWVDLSLHDTLISFLGGLGQKYLASGSAPTRMGNRHYAVGPSGCYEAADDWIVVDAGQDETWRRLAKALRLERLVDDPRFASASRRRAHQDELDALIAEQIAGQPARHWVATLQAEQIPAARVHSVKEILDSDLLAERGMIFAAPAGGADDLRALASPIVIDGVRQGLGTVAPELGQHTLEVLQELGHPRAEAVKLRSAFLAAAETAAESVRRR